MTKTKHRPASDFDIDAISAMIDMWQHQLRSLKAVRGMVLLLVAVLLFAVYVGVVTAWSIMISLGAIIYGLWMSGNAITTISERLVLLNQDLARAKHLHRFYLEFDLQIMEGQLIDWLDNNAPGSSYALGPGWNYMVAFPDEDARMLFRLKFI